MKNKKSFLIVFLIALYLLGLFFISSKDIIYNSSYLREDPYFNSQNFKQYINTYIEDILKLKGEYKDFDLKKDDEKVTENDIKIIKDKYASDLNNKINDIENQYDNNIRNAENNQNSEKVESLKTERKTRISDLRKEYAKTEDEFKKEAISNINVEYKAMVSFVENHNDIIYYFKNNNSSQIYTNLKEGTNVETYLKEDSIYTIKFPLLSYYKTYDFQMQDINKIIKDNNVNGYIIIPKNINKNSLLYMNYKNYNQMRGKLLIELLILFFSLFLSILMLIKVKKEIIFVGNAEEAYKKIPLDLRIILFIIIFFIYASFLEEISFFNGPISIGHFMILTFSALYSLYIVLVFNTMIHNLKREGGFKHELQQSIPCRLFKFIRESSLNKNLFIKVFLFFFSSFFMAICFIMIVKGNSGFSVLMSLIYILCYFTILPLYILKKVNYFNKIIRDTDKIIEGKMDVTIEEKGKGTLKKLAHNINNLKTGIDNSIKKQMKSERLKTELITNVSHDLKTPLTSIINYVDLLKDESLSKEEIKAYVEILDRKSLRLKTLIEDLFEASKMQSGSVELKIEKVDVTALLKQTLGEFDEKIKNSSLTFRSSIPKGNIQLNLDGKRTYRIFENLIGNILKYSQKGTRVYIDLKETDEKVLITFKNISSYEMDFDSEEIFERFKRGDKARNTEGSGLGLAIARSITELEGGTLHIEVDGDLFKAIVEFKK